MQYLLSPVRLQVAVSTETYKSCIILTSFADVSNAILRDFLGFLESLVVET